MYEHCKNLPLVPIPTLQETLPEYLRWVAPYISKEDLEEHKVIAANMAKHSSVLHERLLKF
jgi:hypothetical protein